MTLASSDDSRSGGVQSVALRGALALLSLLVAPVAAAEPARTPIQASPPPSVQEASDGTSVPQSPLAARDADAKTRTLARDLATQGSRAFEEEDWPTALDRFHRAFALFPAPSIAIMEARCLVRLRRLLEALTRYEEVQRMVLSADASKPFRQAIADAKTEAEQVSSWLPRIRITVRAPGAQANGIVVRLDGKSVPSAVLGVECPIDPGRHEIEVMAPGYESETRQTIVAVGQRLDEEFMLTEVGDRPHGTDALSVGDATAKAMPSGATASRPSAKASALSGSSSATWGWAAVGIGATVLGVSAFTGMRALDKMSLLDSACTPTCPPEYADDIDSFRANRDWSYATLGAGAVSLAIGGYLLWRNASESPRPSGPTALGTVPFGTAF